MAELLTKAKRLKAGKTANGNKGGKGKGKRPKPQEAKGPRKIIPVNLYLSECCNAVGVKEPLIRKDKESKEYGQGHLGTFRCSACRKHGKFTSRANSQSEAVYI